MWDLLRVGTLGTVHVLLREFLVILLPGTMTVVTWVWFLRALLMSK